MNFGIPVIAARIGGLPELVVDEVSGLLFAAGDSRDLALKMRRLWDDSEARERFARAARAMVIEKFSATRYVEDLLSIYSQAMDDHLKPRPVPAP
jgi:glycosyltransferase involved in cell wall biosynthesis